MTQKYTIANTFRKLKEISKWVNSLKVEDFIDNPTKIKTQLKTWKKEFQEIKNHIIHTTISPFAIPVSKYGAEHTDIDQPRQFRSFETEETHRNAAIDQLRSAIIALRIAEGIIDEYVPIYKNANAERLSKYKNYAISRLKLIKNLPIGGEYLRIIRESLNPKERKCNKSISRVLATTPKNGTRLAIIKVIHNKNGLQKISTFAITIPKNFKRKIDRIIKTNFGQNARVLRIRYYKMQRALIHNKYSRTAISISYCKTFTEYNLGSIEHILIWDILKHYILNSKRTRERYSGQFPYLVSTPSEDKKDLLESYVSSNSFQQFSEDIIPFELNMNTLLLKLHLEDKYDAELRKIQIFQDSTLGLIAIYLTTNNDLDELLRIFKVSKTDFENTLFKLRLLGFPTSYLNIDLLKLPQFKIKTDNAKKIIRAIKEYVSKKEIDSGNHKNTENITVEKNIRQFIANNQEDLVAQISKLKYKNFKSIYISVRPTVEILFLLANEFPRLKTIYCPPGKYKELSKAVLKIANIAGLSILPLNKGKGRTQKYSKETIHKIKILLDQGKSVSEIAEIMNIPIRTIYHIINNENRYFSENA